MKKSEDFYDQALKKLEKFNLNKANLKEAFFLLKKADKAGDHRATYAIGTWYLHGRYVEVDIDKAFGLITIAAKKNHPSALYDLAIFYEKGVSVRKNAKKAYRLYLSAALRQDKQSFYEVGRCLFYGIGVQADKALANIWLDRARELDVIE